MLDMFFGSLVMAATIRLMVPILLVAIGGCFGHKAGILNIGLESYMAFAAFFSMYGCYLTSNPWIGVLFGVLAGAFCASIFALFVLYFRSHPIVIGIAMNLAAWGGTTFLLKTIFNTRGVFIDSRIISFKPIELPLLSKIPYLQNVVSGQNVLVYMSILILIIAHVVMYKTSFGLRLRGVGINQIASQTVGVSVTRYQWVAVLLGGILSGIGGAYLTIGGSSLFSENMTAGKGFLALAAIMVGNGNPFFVFLACLLFGYTSALSVTLQSIGLPSQIVLSVPYIVTVIVSSVYSYRNNVMGLRKNKKLAARS